MSAWVVSKAHINAMVRYGLGARRRSCGELTWYYNGKHKELTTKTASEIGQLLINENVASVTGRYPNSSYTDLPGPCDAYWVLPYKYHENPYAKYPSAVEAIKLAKCYMYQSCEHPQTFKQEVVSGWGEKWSISHQGILVWLTERIEKNRAGGNISW